MPVAPTPAPPPPQPKMFKLRKTAGLQSLITNCTETWKSRKVTFRFDADLVSYVIFFGHTLQKMSATVQTCETHTKNIYSVSS